MDEAERFKYVNFQIAFLVEQLQDETEEDVMQHVSKKIKDYEKESKQLTCDIMKFRYRSCKKKSNIPPL